MQTSSSANTQTHTHTQIHTHRQTYRQNEKTGLPVSHLYSIIIVNNTDRTEDITSVHIHHHEYKGKTHADSAHVLPLSPTTCISTMCVSASSPVEKDFVNSVSSSSSSRVSERRRPTHAKTARTAADPTNEPCLSAYFHC